MSSDNFLVFRYIHRFHKFVDLIILVFRYGETLLDVLFVGGIISAGGAIEGNVRTSVSLHFFSEMFIGMFVVSLQVCHVLIGMFVVSVEDLSQILNVCFFCYL
jgi:hypothetical protein